MAKKIEEKLMKVKALVNIKYDKDCIEIGNTFKAREKDVAEMVEKGYGEALDETPEENEDEGQGETPKDGE